MSYVHELTNKTSYAKSRYKHLVCPVCGTNFHRPPSHVTRLVGPAVCSRGCSAIARRVRVIVNCVSCQKPMEVTPSNVPRKTTCSRECSTLRRTKVGNHKKPSVFADYLKRIKEIAELSKCAVCETTTGPWAVCGVKSSMSDTGVVTIDSDNAVLKCRKCHLNNIIPLALPARKAKHGY